MVPLLRATVCWLGLLGLATLPSLAWAQLKNVRVLVAERCWNEPHIKARPMARVDVKLTSRSINYNDVIRETGADGRALFQVGGRLYDVSARSLASADATLEFVGINGARMDPHPDTKVVQNLVIERDIELDVRMVRRNCAEAPPPPPPPPPRPPTPPPPPPPPVAAGPACPPSLAGEYARLLQARSMLGLQLLYPDVDPLTRATQPVLRAGIAKLVNTASMAADSLGSLADGIAIAIDNELQDSIARKGARDDYAGVDADTELALQLGRARQRVQPLLQDWNQRWRAKAQAASAIGQALPGNTPDMRRSMQRNLDLIDIRLLNAQNLAAQFRCQLPNAPAAAPGRPETVLLGLHPPLDLNAQAPVETMSKADTIAMGVIGTWLTQSELGDQNPLTGAAEAIAREQGTTLNVTLYGPGQVPAVRTPEATIQPDGTAFLVHRDAERRVTFVYVGEGAVSVTPQRGARLRLTAGQFGLVTFRGVRLLAPRGGASAAPGSIGAPPAGNSLFEVDTNRQGSDYAAFDLAGADPQPCLERCRGDHRCRAWTYVKPGVQGPNARCYLKTPAPRPSANRCCISGVFTRFVDPSVQFEIDTDRNGSDFANIELPVADPQVCHDRCRGDGRCAAWTFVRPGVQGANARCYLKNPAPAPTRNHCCISAAMGSVAPPHPPLPLPPPAFPPVMPLSPQRPAVIESLGQVWVEVEEGEQAVWTRRPGSNTFDASWSNGRVRAVLDMTLDGSQLTIRRTQGSDGYDCTYTGTLDGKQARGTFGCNRFTGQKPWRATIDGGGPGAQTAPAGAPRLLGCFKDPNNPFDLAGHLVRSAQNSPQRCIETCAGLGFKLAGVQYGQSCLCGNSYGRFGPADNCNMPCTGDASQVCGGINANSVYSTGR